MSNHVHVAMSYHKDTHRDGYGAPVDSVIEDLCSEWGPGDYMMLALAAAEPAMAPGIGGIALRHSSRWGPGLAEYVLTFEVVKGAMLDHLLPRPGHIAVALAAVSGPVDQLRLMLAALDQAGLSVAGQRAVVELLQREAQA